MSQSEIEVICKALIDLPMIHYLIFDVEDWNISCAVGSLVMTRKVSAKAASAKEQKPLIIRTGKDGKLKDSDE